MSRYHPSPTAATALTVATTAPIHQRRALRGVIAKHLRRAPPDEADSRSYNVLQRVTYLLVIFVLAPLVIWTGLAMSSGFNAAVPWAVDSVGGRQSARTLHFFVSVFLVLFLLVHVAMIVLTGFASRMREMITGLAAPQERA